MAASKVDIRKVDGRYSLYVNDEPFEVKGAGIDWGNNPNLQALVDAGGNSFRTWRPDHIEEELQIAAKMGLMVAVGLEMGQELHGFDYHDKEAVQAQFNEFKAVIDAYKEHPNLLCWVVGNEINLLFDGTDERPLVDPAAYHALTDICDYIHQVDGNHPVTTAFAGLRKIDIEHALEHCSSLDFLSYQVYGELGVMPKLIKKNGVEMPFMVTEFGAKGHWEMKPTKWGREIEQPSAVKAEALAKRMHKGFTKDKSGLNIGHFIFYWGQKQERTPTWYGIFNATGEPDARIDEITRFWTGGYPEHRAPSVRKIKLNKKKARKSVVVEPASKAKAKVSLDEKDASFEYKWVLMKESEARVEGGAFEPEPETLELEILSSSEGKLKFMTPDEPGEYRLFSYVYDGKGKVGNANFPFLVKG